MPFVNLGDNLCGVNNKSFLPIVSISLILENISSGLYEVVITDGAETLKHRLIIQK